MPCSDQDAVMKRVLFVDDEPQVLDALKASLAPLREEWEMEFLSTAEQALASLERTPADVVLADIHLLGMGGLQLLGEIKARYPQTVRLAFSGCAHQDMVLKGLTVAHQVLPKPLTPAALKTTISRTCAQRDVLRNPGLQRLVSSVHHLPSLPSLYQELEASMQAADSTAEKAAKIIAKDPAMVTNLLHVVNSAYFNLRRTIASPAHAVALLGLGTVKSLVLSLKVFEQTHRDPALKPLIEQLWQHGILVARVAKALASHEGLGTLRIEQAFLAGLLHDLGRLVLAVNLPDEYARWEQCVKQGNHAPLQAEQQVFGATHAEVGAYLLSVWGLTESIVEAVAFHHVPMEAQSPEFTILTALHVANAWNDSVPTPGVEPSLDTTYLALIGSGGRLANWKEVCQATM